MNDTLSTAPSISTYEDQNVEIPAGDSARVCSKPFAWVGDRSFKAVIRQSGYAAQEMVRNVGELSLPVDGSTATYALEVRNPLSRAAAIELTVSAVGLPGWQVTLPDSLTLKAGEAKQITVQVSSSISAQSDLSHTYPGDAGRVEIWAHTPDGALVGGAWLQVWERQPGEYNLLMPLISNSATKRGRSNAGALPYLDHRSHLPMVAR